MAIQPPKNVAVSTLASDSLSFSFTKSISDSSMSAGNHYNMRHSLDSRMNSPTTTSDYVTADGSSVYSGTITGLSSGTTYWVQFQYENAAGDQSTWADASPDSATTSAVVPGTPGTPSVSAKTTSTIDFSWSAASGTVTGYKLYFGTNNPPTNIVNGTTQSGTTKQFTSLSIGASPYYFRVKAYNSAGDSSYSSTQTTDTLTATPDAPVLSDNKPTRNDIAWTAPTGTANSYLVAGTSTNPTSIISTQSGTGAKTFEHTGLDPGDEYFYRVRTATTYADGLYSSYSGNSSATNPSIDLPTSIAYEALSTTDVRFSFAEPATWGTRVYAYDSSGNQLEKSGDDWLDVDNSGTTTFDASDWMDDDSDSLNQGASQNTALQVGAIKFKTYYDGEYTGFTSTITGYTLPGPPTSVSATATSYDAIALGWTNPAGSALSETFTIQRKEGSGGTYADIATGETGTTYTDSDSLSQSTEYYYQIKTVTTAGVSAYSSGVNATTAAGPNPVAGDTLQLGKLGVATGDTSDDEDEISMGTASGGTSEVKMSDFFLGSLVAVTGNSIIPAPTATAVYEVTRQNIGSEWTEQIKSVAANFTWSINNSNGSVQTNNGYRATIQATGGYTSTFAISCVYTGPFNDHMTTGEKTATPKTVTIGY